MAVERSFGTVLGEAVMVGIGLCIVAALCFGILYFFRKTDVHLVIDCKMHTGLPSYLAILLFLFVVGALFHVIFEMLGWNHLYCHKQFGAPSA